MSENPKSERGDPSLGLRMLRLLPRVALLLFLIALLIVFRAVLLPFALAIFLAFLLYPLVALLERGSLDARRLPSWVPARSMWERLPALSWRMPRWLSVITIYGVLITVGWWTVPPMALSLASELTQLKDTIPQLFRSLNEWQSNAHNRIASLLEVKAPSQPNLDELSNNLKQLRTGALQRRGSPLLPVMPNDGTEENGNGAAAVESPAAAPNFSLFHLEIVLPSGAPVPAAAPGSSGNRSSDSPPSNGADSGTAAGSESPLAPELSEGRPADPGNGPDDEGPGGEVDTASTDARESDEELPEGDQERFSHEARESALQELESYLTTVLSEPGPAPRDLPQRMEQLVVEVNRRHLLLDPQDEGLRVFQERVRDQVATMIRREEYIDLLDQETQRLLVTGRSWAAEQLKQTTRVVPLVLGGIFEFFMILMITAFFLVFFPRVLDYVRDLVPPQYRDDYTAILGRIDTRLSGAIRGQVIICVVNGLLTYPGVYWCGRLFDAPALTSFALLLSLVATVLSLIPIFGVIISTVPMVLLALTQSWWAAVAVIAWICIIHAVEAYILNPHILGHSAQMNPIIVVFALLAGKHVGGLIGALLAVPIASVVVALFGFYRRRMARVYALESGLEVPEDRWDD